MRVKTAAILLVSLLYISNIYADIIMTLKDFHGGSVNMQFNFQTDSLYGSRGDGLRDGGTVSTLDFHQSLTSYNPACLAFQKNAVASLSLIPYNLGVSTDTVASFAGESVVKMINDQLKDSFNTMTKTAGVTASIDSAEGGIFQSAGITGIEVMAPFAGNNAGFGVAREEKMALDFNMLLNGTEVLLNLKDTTNNIIDVDARAKISAVANLSVRNVVTTVGFGRKLTPIWGIGFVLERYESNFYGDARAQMDASAQFAGNLFEFNTNPGNSLDQYIHGDLSAEAWGFRFGTSLHSPDDSVETAVDFSIQPELKYAGSVNGVYHTPPSSIDISDVTKTDEKTVNNADWPVTIKLPSFARVTLAWKPGAVIAFNYTHYFDPFYVNVGQDRASLDMIDAFRLGFNFGVFQFGGGVILTNISSKSVDQITGVETRTLMWFPVPVFSTGFVIPWGKYVETEIELIAVPFPALKSAVTYNF